MDTPTLRNRAREPTLVENSPQKGDRTLERSDDCLQPPSFKIDLSLPPFERYQGLARVFKDRLRELPVLFDEIVQEAGLSPRWVRKIASLFLRRVDSTEETEELRGISKVTGIEMYLLVAFNVLLDLFMGCTSGGVKVQEAGQEPRMLHFRTLDWGMDVLRKVIVQLDFAWRSQGHVIASTITYVGFVGVLTGVREGLSLSLNFRPCHSNTTRLANFRYYLNHLLVLLGFRPSISSLLRQCLLPSMASQPRFAHIDGVQAVEQQFPAIVTTAAYVIASDGDRTIVLEKDRADAVVMPSCDFVVATNHDTREETREEAASSSADADNTALQITGMEGLVEESIYRKKIICDLREKTLRKKDRMKPRNPDRAVHGITKRDVIKWMNTYPITNEETHYATIMDPRAGNILWAQRYIVSPFDEDTASGKVL